MKLALLSIFLALPLAAQSHDDDLRARLQADRLTAINAGKFLLAQDLGEAIEQLPEHPASHYRNPVPTPRDKAQTHAALTMSGANRNTAGVVKKQ